MPLLDRPLVVDTTCGFGLQPFTTGQQQSMVLESAPAISACPSSGADLVPAPSGLPAGGIAAVSLTVTVANGSSSHGGYLAVYPDSIDANPESTGSDTQQLEFDEGETVSQAITVQTGSSGRITPRISARCSWSSAAS